MTLLADPAGPPLQIDRTGLPGEGFGEGEASHTPMNPKGSADLTGSRATDKFAMRARAARVASLDRNVEHVLVSL